MTMREVYYVKNKPIEKKRMISVLAGFFVSIDWNDPDAPILSGLGKDGPWSDTKVTTKQYGAAAR